MLLSHRYRFLFVHIAKTGGTSVRSSLQRYRWRDPWYPLMALCSRLSHLSGHRLACKLPRHAKAIAAWEMLPRDFFDSLYKFAFVRNPWDLQVSSWHHLQRERPHLVAHCRDFPEFMRFKLDPQRPPQYHLDRSSESQTAYLVDLQGRLLVDYVGRYENLAADFHHICRHIGISPPPLAHKRQAAHRQDYRSYYDDATAELVAQHYAPDIQRFDYRF